jgi:hypothetical protein
VNQKTHIGCPVEWFIWAIGLTRSKEQLALALYLYRRACILRSATVTVPSQELAAFGFGRWSKYRLLVALEEHGVVRVEQRNGRSLKVTLARWP